MGYPNIGKKVSWKSRKEREQEVQRIFESWDKNELIEKLIYYMDDEEQEEFVKENQ